MKESIQANNFYEALDGGQKKDLLEAIAADIFFLNEDLQQKVIELLSEVNPQIAEEIRRINNFTSR